MSALPTGLAAAAMGAPLFSALGFPLVTFAIGQFFSLVCHQEAARSFWIAGAPVAVCARCLGIYLGAAAGAWIRAERRRLLHALGAIVALSLLDFVAELAGLHGGWPLVRFALGGTLGTTLGALVAGSRCRDSRNKARLELIS